MATELKDVSTSRATYDVGGIQLDRPFRIRRLGHFGFNVQDVHKCLEFYTDLLGFSIADPIDFGHRIEDPEEREKIGNTTGYFLRHGTDHHSFVVFPWKALHAMAGKPDWQDMTINQITWQVGSLREVGRATEWLGDEGVSIRRVGRDMPGSNWHVYPFDPERNINELYYGIEQIGWDGRSKPRTMHLKGFTDKPPLPQISEYREVQNAVAEGVDVTSGYRHEPDSEGTYDVGGILLPRPFKITRIGPLRLFVADIEASTSYYRDRLGLTVTEETVWNGHRCVFLRANTEHHSIALYPKAIRDELELNPRTRCMSFGLQVADYSQLRAAIDFLKERDVEIKYLPPELSPGVDYSACAIDPDGHALQLYYYMEQVGWDGRPRPPEMRRKIDNENWPETLDPLSDSYEGEPYMGPWG